MKNIVHRMCVICPFGHFKCNSKSIVRTCSTQCSSIYSRKSDKFDGFPDKWYTKQDIPARRGAIVIRIGDLLVFKTAWEKQRQVAKDEQMIKDLKASKKPRAVKKPMVIRA